MARCRASTTLVDCDDSNRNVNPGVINEVCGDGLDNDCKNGVDDGCIAPCIDVDSDRYGVGPDVRACAVTTDVDCDDGDFNRNPGATEICGNIVDEDCDSIAQSCPIVCGNGRIDAGEACDDACGGPNSPTPCDAGTPDNFDGCSVTCQDENCLEDTISTPNPFLNNLVAWWDGSSATILGPVFTNLGSIAYNVPGKVDGAFEMSGTGGALTSAIGGTALPYGSSEFSFAVWVKPATGVTTTQRILTYGACTGGVTLSYTPPTELKGKFVLTVGSSTVQYAINTPTEWYFVVVALNPSVGDMALYVNGAKVVHLDPGGISIPGQCSNVLGSNYQGTLPPQQPFIGQIDEAQYYAQRLTDGATGDIMKIYTAGSAGVCKPKK